MFFVSKYILTVLVAFQLLILVKSEEVKQSGRNYDDYFRLEDQPMSEYQTFQSYNNDYTNCQNSPMLRLLGRGLNMLLLNLGFFGVLKGVLTLLAVGFLPVLVLKAAVVKSFILPFIAIPLLLHYVTNQTNQTGDGDMGGETMESSQEPSTPMNPMGMGQRSHAGDDLTSLAWKSVKTFAESEKCIERISCLLGASNNASLSGSFFSRITKLLHATSPPIAQQKMLLITNAFNKGRKTMTCSEDEYKCDSPELLLQHGLKKIKIL